MWVNACIYKRKNIYLCGDECTAFFIISFLCIGVVQMKLKNFWLFKIIPYIIFCSESRLKSAITTINNINYFFFKKFKIIFVSSWKMHDHEYHPNLNPNIKKKL